MRHPACSVYTMAVSSVYRRWTVPAVRLTSIRLDTHLADEARKLLGVRSRTEAVHTALREVVASRRFKALMRKHAGKLSFAAHGE